MCLFASYPAVPGVLNPCESPLVADDTVSTPRTVRTIQASATRRRWRRARRVIECMAGKLGTLDSRVVGRADAPSLLSEMYGSPHNGRRVRVEKYPTAPAPRDHFRRRSKTHASSH